MSRFVALTGKTAAMARSAVHLYFEPLSPLVNAVSTFSTGTSLTGALLALPPTDRLWRTVERSRQQLRDAQRSRQGSRIDAAMAELDAELEELDQLTRVVDGEYREMAARWSCRADSNAQLLGTFYYQASMSSSLTVAAWLLVALEAVVATTIGVLFLGLSIATAVPFGAGMALVLFSATAAVADVTILGKHEGDPRVARDALVRQMLLWGPACLGVLGALLMGRTVEAVAPAAGLLLGVFAVISPVLAGLFRTGARLMGWSRDLTRRIDELADLRSTVRSLRVEAAVLRNEHRSPEPPFGRPTRAITIE